MDPIEPTPAAALREGRRVEATVLFADVGGFSALAAERGPEEAYAHTTACAGLLDEILRHYGGSVDRYLGDAFMALFGYPVPSDGAALQAAEAALAMRRAVARYNAEAGLSRGFGLSVGINTGPMVAGETSGLVVREFHVLGDAVNTAARLKSKAPAGSVYLGPQTAAAVESCFALRALAPIALKGKERPVPAFAVLARRRGATRPRPPRADRELVGRVPEAARLRAELDALAGGAGGALAVLGASGFGKSRMLELLAAEARAAGVAVVVLGADEDATEPGSLFAPLESERGRAGVAESADRSVRSLCERAARAPLLLLLDDLERADPASLAAVAALARRTGELPLRIVATARSGRGGELPAAVREALAPAGLATLTLGPLQDADARRLVASLLDPDAPRAQEVIDVAVRRAAGNPRQLAFGAHLGGALLSESERERAGGERASEAERRRATVMFADITGFTAMSEKLDPAEAYPIVADCLALLDGIAREHGGTVDKHLGDCVLVLFGVPRALEDAPRAAINAAIEMVESVRSFSRERGLATPLDVHIGIHTALGVAGEVGGSLLREYALMGDPTSIASALTDRASRGEIYVGPETRRATEGDFGYRAVEPLRLKDRGESVEAFELVSRRQRLHRARPGAGRRVFSRLVGRERELSLLCEAAGRLHDGRGAVASVVAEAGVGKSRLVLEFVARGTELGLRFAEGRSLSTGRQLAYHAFSDLFRSWAAITDDDDDATARERLRALLADALEGEADDALTYVAALMGLPLAPDERERIARVEPDARERVTRSAVVRAVRAASRRRPLALVFDDLHWADASSLELLDSIVGLTAGGPLLLVLVFRPGYPDTSGRLLETVRAEASLHHVEVPVSPLEVGAARELLRNLFGRGDVPYAIRQRIEERARGNPFYIEEVVRSLLDEGALEAVEGGFRATPRIAEAVVPGTVQEVVMARVDRLPLRRRQLLQVASVVGQSAHHEVLAAFETAPGQLVDDVSALIEAEFLTPEDRLPGLEYAFQHPLIQEVTYDGIVPARRRELHRRVAEAIESRLPEGTPGFAGMLAWHFGQGDAAERAEHYLFRAGDEAAQVAASSEALQFFREASRLYLELHGEGGDPTKKALLEKKVALALYHRGQLMEADQHLGRALRLLGERVASGRVGLALRFARDASGVLGRLYLPRARRKRPATDRDREVIDLMMRRAEAQTTASPTRFVFDSMATLARLDRVEPSSVPGAGGMYAGTVGIFSYGGLSFATSRRFLARAERLVDPDDADEYLYYRVMRFLHHLLEGDWSDEHALDDAMLEEGLRAGRLWAVSNYLDLEAMRRLYRGEWAPARARIGRLREIADRFGHDLARSAADADAATLHLERRELDEAVRGFESYREDHPEGAFQVSALGACAAAETLAGDLAAADETLRRAERHLRETGRVLPFHLSSYLVARYHRDVVALERQPTPGARRRARASRRAALAVAGRVAWRRGEALRLAARHAWLLGRREEALGAWERALESAERLGARPELARTHLEIAARLAPLGDGAPGLRGRSPAQHRELAGALLGALGLEREFGAPSAG